MKDKSCSPLPVPPKKVRLVVCESVKIPASAESVTVNVIPSEPESLTLIPLPAFVEKTRAAAGLVDTSTGAETLGTVAASTAMSTTTVAVICVSEPKIDCDTVTASESLSIAS